MLSDEEFYAAVLPHLRAKRAGQEPKITPKDASATCSNGQKDSDGVTESTPPNDPILSIIVRTRAAPHTRYTGRWLSSEHKGTAVPIVMPDATSKVDGIITLDNGVSEEVSLAECKVYPRAVSKGRTRSDTVAFRMKSVRAPDEMQFVITFDGQPGLDGDFIADDHKLTQVAGDWAVRWVFRSKHGR